MATTTVHTATSTVQTSSSTTQAKTTRTPQTPKQVLYRYFLTNLNSANVRTFLQEDSSKSTSENGPPKMSYALIVAKAKAKKEAESSSEDSSSGGNNNVSKDSLADGDAVDNELPADSKTPKFEIGRGRGRTQLPRNMQYRNVARRDYDRVPVRK